MRKDQGPIAQRILIELQAREAAGIAPQAGGDEVERVFEIAVLGLKVMGAEIHSFGPDGLGERSHSAPPRLRKQDNQFHLRIGDVTRHMGREIARTGHRLPRRPGLVEAEVLVLHFDRESRWAGWEYA